MFKLAESRNGKCLSEKYEGANRKLSWECEKGHQWEARPSNVKRGHWCPYCYGRNKDISGMHALAKQNNGKCLSEEYKGAHQKLLWECSKGHQWEAVPNSIRQGTWCPYCAGRAPLTIEEMQKFATERGGKCLSKKYVNIDTKLSWECSEGHKWEAVPDSIKRGTWCPYCTKNVLLTIDEMHQLAEEKGGKCLSDAYVNANTKLLWECSKGHRWEARPGKIRSGQWCPHCSGKVPLTIEEMQKIATERGGKCISDKYITARKSLLWQCAFGHQWKATPSKIKCGGWCPECSSGLGERICREFFEQLFGCRFPKTYPKWLKNQEGNQMELDGHCKLLKLAFEHHGQQHYSYNLFYHEDLDAFKKRQRDDEEKIRLCKQHGVNLIEIPEVFTMIEVDQIKEHIKQICEKNSIDLPSDYQDKTVNLKKAYSSQYSVEKLNEAGQIAKQKNGKCLSDAYVNANTKLLWECSKGHQWGAILSNIKKGQWCPHCSGRVPLTIEEMQKLATKRGGKCLSTKYVNSDTKLSLQCSKGHQWEAVPDHIKNRGSWCPYCAQRIRCTIEEMREVAIERGGKCLSEKYGNAKTKLLWECSKGHRWEAAPDPIKRGKWCPKCANNKRSQKRRLTIEEMQKIATERGGKCISDKYINSQTKLTWECSEGHRWEAVPNSVKCGTWCPKCAKRKRKQLQIES